MNGTLTVVGSGEMTPGMAKVHRAIMARNSAQSASVFLDTPAGFELNCDVISAKALSYFADELNTPIEIASFRNADTSSEAETALAMQTLRRANYIFAGPGSPTYCVRNWRNSPVFETVVAKLHAGAQVMFASAAAISLGAYALPVYEIYKVGATPHWIDGLDVLGRFGFEAVVVPHWNNNSSGTHDTTCCFIGHARFEALRRQLPASAIVFGIDEYTACTLDFEAHICTVSGAGSVTLLQGDERLMFGSGESFPIERLGSMRDQPAAAPANPLAHQPLEQTFQTALETARDPAAALGTLHILMDHIARVPHDAAAHTRSLRMIREMTAQLAVWLESDPRLATIATAPNTDADLWLDLLVKLRMTLRETKQYALADSLRSDLAEHGITIEDTAHGSIWKR